jgi:hypothetical protein
LSILNSFPSGRTLKTGLAQNWRGKFSDQAANAEQCTTLIASDETLCNVAYCTCLVLFIDSVVTSVRVEISNRTFLTLGIDGCG